MPANIGEMFYTGEIPWHGEGRCLPKPATLTEAIIAGNLDWEVGCVDIQTKEAPPSPIPRRKAIVRLDRRPGNPGRVLGVAHRGFQPLQNAAGAQIFDDIFGRGRPVYHTGGWLGRGERVWLLAKIDRELEIAKGDIVRPYALFANSHDGSMAFCIRLTTVRVVCQNTLAMAMQEKKYGEFFRRAHQGTNREHAEAAQSFFAQIIQEYNATSDLYASMTRRNCDNDHFYTIVNTLLPFPKKPANAAKNPGLLKAWENRTEATKQAREKVAELRENGKGMDLPGSRGTYWGVLNAVLEFEDHHRAIKGSRLSYALLGDGMDLKVRAFNLIRQEVVKA